MKQGAKIGLVVIIAVIIILLIYAFLKSQQKSKEDTVRVGLVSLSSKFTDAVNNNTCTTTKLMDELKAEQERVIAEYIKIKDSLLLDENLRIETEKNLADISKDMDKLNAMPTCYSLCLEANYDEATGKCSCPTGMFAFTGATGNTYCQTQDCASIPQSHYNRVSNFSGACECNLGYVFNQDRSRCITCEESVPNSYFSNEGKCECKTGYTGPVNGTCVSITSIHDVSLNQVQNKLGNLSLSLDQIARTNPSHSIIPSNASYIPPAKIETPINAYLPHYAETCMEDTYESRYKSGVKYLENTSVDKCAEIAKAQGYRHFKIGEPGECFIGPLPDTVKKINTCTIGADGYTYGEAATNTRPIASVLYKIN